MHAQVLATQYSDHIQEQKWCQNKYSRNLIHIPACTTSPKCNSHIRSNNSSETGIQCESRDSHDHKIKDNLIRAHVPSACIFSGCQSVHMHRCSQCAGVWRKHRAGRRKTDLIGWFWCVMCSLGYSRICNDTKRARVWITDRMWTCALVLHLAPE